MTPDDRPRCDWARDGLLRDYHDAEWGVPVHDDRLFFEFLILEGAQAGLSWDTILRRRENYRKAFANFDVKKVARFGEREVERLRPVPAPSQRARPQQRDLGATTVRGALRARERLLDQRFARDEAVLEEFGGLK